MMFRLFLLGVASGFGLLGLGASAERISLENRLSDVEVIVARDVKNDMAMMEKMDQAAVEPLSQDEVDFLVEFMRNPTPQLEKAVEKRAWSPDPIILRIT